MTEAFMNEENGDTYVRAWHLIFGVATGDAMGFPVQFYTREQAKKLNVTGMTAHRSGLYPAGSWSDDTSMTLVLADSLCEKDALDYGDIMGRFSDWLGKGRYTPGGRAYDVGRTCFRALMRYHDGVAPLDCGGLAKTDNGNGSLMRISPLVLYLRKKYGDSAFDDGRAFDAVHDVSRLTHAHPVALVGCDIFLAVLLALMNGMPKDAAVARGTAQVSVFVQKHSEYREAFAAYNRISGEGFRELSEEKISSSGYVVETLEAALWCFLTTDSYRTCILKILGLGRDTDSIGAVAGAMAGIHYAGSGEKDIPQEWSGALQGQDLLVRTALRLAERY